MNACCCSKADAMGHNKALIACIGMHYRQVSLSHICVALRWQVAYVGAAVAVVACGAGEAALAASALVGGASRCRDRTGGAPRTARPSCQVELEPAYREANCAVVSVHDCTTSGQHMAGQVGMTGMV